MTRAISRTRKSIHIQLPLDVHAALVREARGRREPLTRVARIAIDEWLRGQHRSMVREQLAAYVAGAAGTADDRDVALQEAALEHLASEQTTTEGTDGGHAATR